MFAFFSSMKNLVKNCKSKRDLLGSPAKSIAKIRVILDHIKVSEKGFCQSLATPSHDLSRLGLPHKSKAWSKDPYDLSELAGQISYFAVETCQFCRTESFFWSNWPSSGRMVCLILSSSLSSVGLSRYICIMVDPSVSYNKLNAKRPKFRLQWATKIP